MTLFDSYDYLWMGIYLLGLLGLTLYLYKKASAGMEGYYLGARSIPWWAMGISGMVTQLDMAGTMLLVSLLTLLGPQGLYIEVRGGLALLVAFAMVFQGKWNRRSWCMTVAEWMEFRFGSGWAGQLARMIQALAMLILTIGMLAYFVKGSGLFLSIFFPFSPEACALTLIVITTFYTVLTGFYGVVYTDLFQCLFIVGGMIVIALTAIPLVPSAEEFSSMAASVSGYQNWGSVEIPWEADMPKAYEGFRMFGIAFVYYIIFTILVGVSRSGGKPTYFGARSDRECGTLSLIWILSSSIRWPLIIGFVIIGVHLSTTLFPDGNTVARAAEVIKQEYPHVQEHSWGAVVSEMTRQENENAAASELNALLGDDWRDKIALVSYYGDINKEEILPAVIRYAVPSGLRGLIFVALIAAAMSTFSGQLNTAAAYFVRDIYQRHMRPAATQRELIWTSYITCVAIVAASFLMGYYSKSINDIRGWIMLSLGGGLAFPALLRWFWWRFNGCGYAVGTLAGMIAAIVQRLYFNELPVWYSFPSILAVSAIGCVVGTYLSKPTDDAVVMKFYEKTRPFGVWGRFKTRLSPEYQQAIARENRNDIIATFFAAPGQFLLYWIPVTFMLKDWDACLYGALGLIVCSIALYWFWYKPLPKD